MTYCLDPISIQNPHQLFQGIGYEISFWCETIGSRFRVQGMRLVSDMEHLISFQGTGYEISFWCGTIGSRFRVQGMRSSGFRVSSGEVGNPYIKGSGFPSFRFSPSPLIPTQVFYSSFKHLALVTCLPILKISFALLVKPVVPPSGI
jgi:hypothetical protein